ncbi:class I SAM-dependent methyltransferase [Sphingomonas sp.]|uniref:class I SAM-dependent methyltransferase n=1 Tax=Sphingomonas sp. TaxID=28214 RepID=UPI003B00AA48
MRALVAIMPLAAAVATMAVAAPKKAPAPAVAPKKAAPTVAAAGHIKVDPAIARAVADPGRSAADRARDKYRHPAETLSFFGLKPGMTVVEMLPGGGWYSAILAPTLAAEGRYVAAVPPGKATESFNALVAGDQPRYGKAAIVTYTPGQQTELVPAGTADMVLTFRNIHNLLGEPGQPGDGDAPQAFADWFRALKPGGTLGIEEHRLPEPSDAALEKTNGYVKRSTVIRLAMAAGFRLEGASDVNANPKDDHDHPKGVWTLPPTFALGDQDRAKYAAIGESDRMTLRFVKPQAGG